MKNLFTSTDYNEIKAKAIELGIKWTGVKKEAILENINAKLNELAEAAKKPAKWYDGNTEFAEGDKIQIKGTTMNKAGVAKPILANRFAEVVGFSTTENKLRVKLFDNTGALQKCIITVEIENVNKVDQIELAEVPAKKEDENTEDVAV